MKLGNRRKECSTNEHKSLQYPTKTTFFVEKKNKKNKTGIAKYKKYRNFQKKKRNEDKKKEFFIEKFVMKRKRF